MYGKIKDTLQAEIEYLKNNGLFKSERIITSSQDAVIKISTGEEVINFCANNYLGLSNHPEIIQAAKDTLWNVFSSFYLWYARYSQTIRAKDC
jgi:glycine C-acetyltransferase